MNKIVMLTFIAVSIGIVGFWMNKQYGQKQGEIVNNGQNMRLTSLDFENNGNIPVAYTCDGQNQIPRLRWENISKRAKSLAIICLDPDAPGKTFVHWIVFNISPSSDVIESKDDIFRLNARQGQNDFGKNEWGGPCPPPTHQAHHYHFTLFALNETLDLPEGVSYEQIKEKINAHTIEKSELTGLYKRKSA